MSADSGRELADEIGRLLYGVPASPFSVSEVSVSYAPNPFVGGVGAIVTWKQGEVTADERYLQCASCGTMLPIVNTPEGPCDMCGGVLEVRGAIVDNV